MNTKRHPYEIQNRRGMILLLVVAVLVLLALMGTVYILSASTDKQVSYASNDQANLNYATQGMLSVVRADILNTTLGPGGVPLALGSATPARVWTGPDLGYVNNGIIATPMEDPTPSGAQPTPGTDVQIASQPWLCSAMPLEPNTNYAPGTTLVVSAAGTPPPPLTAAPVLTEEVYGASPPAKPAGAYTPLISYLTPYLYDPADGQYDLSYDSAQLGTASGAAIYVPNASVVMPGSRYDPAEAETDNNPLIPFGTRDAMWNLLPYSSPNGTHYRFAVRIMDTSAMMNVNTGWIFNATSPSQSGTDNGLYGATGAAMAAYPLYYLPGTYNINDQTATEGMQAYNTPPTPPTRAGTYNPQYYDLLGWEQELEYYENQGVPNTSNVYLSLYGSGTELQWLAYGGAGGQFGLLAPNRLSSQMPDTFGTGTAYPYGTGYQDFYTTYSWSRQYASFNAGAPGFATSATTTAAAPLYPSRVNLNADINPSTSSSAQIGTLASQIAAGLQACGFKGFQLDHAYAYAINYLDYRYVSQSPASLYGSSLTYYNGTTLVSATLTGTTAPSGVALIGNALQPCLNEFEVTLDNTGTLAAPDTSVTGYGVELYNPYSVAINVGGWQIQFLDGTTSEGTYPIPAGTSIGAGQYLVIYSGNAPGAPTTTIPGWLPGPALSSAAATAMASGGYAVLEAPCPNLPSIAGISAGFGAVDATGYTVAQGQTPAGVSYVDVSRSDAAPAGYAYPCENAIPGLISVTPSASPAAVSLDAANPAAAVNATAPGAPIPLYNRAAGDPVDTSFAPALANNYQILNWADANCIARECSTESGTTFDPITWRLGARAVGSYVKNQPSIPQDGATVGGYTAMAQEQFLAQLYFDFPFDPRAALTSADMPTTGIVEPNVLTMFSLNARADNPTVTPVGLAYPSLLTRTPGLINVNTAGEVPLYDAIYEAAAAVAGTQGPADDSQLVADTIAYRDRLGAGSGTGGTITLPTFQSTPGGTASLQSETVPTNYSTYPGYNIKSLGDLLLAWLPELEAINKAAGGGAAPASFLQRDILWADCANNFCVHSDSFAVYGLVQAIRLNPNYTGATGAVPPATDWYTASQEIPYSNAVSTNEGYVVPQLIASTSSVTVGIGTASRTIIPEFILEGQRRFVAIVDSSYSTPPGATAAPPAPKIVAMKILPQ